MIFQLWIYIALSEPNVFMSLICVQSLIMAQWMHMSQMIHCLPDDTINNLYPPSAFPIEVRHFLAEWIESQRW